MTDTRFVLALADDAVRVKQTDGTVVIDELPGVVLVEADLPIAVTLARNGEYVGVYRNLADAHRAFALFQPTS
jgi:hypothetical protein